MSELNGTEGGVNSEDAESANIHMTISVPFATSDTLGVPSERTNTGVWVMGAGTSGAHLMIPGR